MGYDSIEEIQKQTHEWDFIKELPETIGVFKKKITDYIEGQVLFICRYEAPELRASVDLTYSAETFDYIMVRTMGLNSFRDVRLIYKERDVFEEKTKKYLPLVISNMEHPEQVNLGELYEAKKVEDWEFGKTLPKRIGSFELYIDPSHAIEHINGSIILIDYSDFARRDQLIIMYNRLRDEFFGELKVNSVFRTTTSFDGRNVKELEDKLKKNLEPTLKWVSETDHTI